MAYYDRGSSGERPTFLGYFIASLAGVLVGAILVGSILLSLPIMNGSNTSSGTESTPAASTGTNLIKPSTDLILSPVADVAAVVGPSVVKVSTKGQEVVYSFFSIPIVQETEGMGSGVIISSDGYIITNAHVVKNVTEAKVTLNDGREFAATVVGSDQYTDIAVLKVEASGLPAASMGDSDYLRVGELAVAIGNPYGFDHTVSAGVISALNRSLEMDNGVTMAGVIQTDAPINPGNSGGALVSSEGLVIGINTAIYEDAQNIGFAIPIKAAMEAAEEIIQYGKVRRAYIGLVEYIDINDMIAQRYGLASKTGVMVYTTDRNGPLAAAGLVRGDIIVEMNERTLTKGSEIGDYLSKAEIGSKMLIAYYDKNGKKKTVELTLAEMP